MSHPSRPQARGPARRRRRALRIEAVQALEGRQLLAPILTLGDTTATFTAAATPTNDNLGTVSVTTSATPDPNSMAGLATVTELAPISEFGDNIVSIAAGPGGVFGNSIYAITRGLGDNAGLNPSDVSRPGVIYRVDPATGKASVFFDLNTLIQQLEPGVPGANASNSVGASTGLVNWYSITFDPEGTFDGKPSMFVASVNRSDPAKNAIYQIGPDGSFLGAFVQFTAGQSALKFNINPTAILVPPPEDQSFLRGLISGAGGSTSFSTTTQFSALFFNANVYSPGQNISTAVLPPGVTQTAMNLGPQLGLTAANDTYLSRVYDVFTDFGTPGAGGIPAAPGLSGVQGLNGDLLITQGTNPPSGVIASGFPTGPNGNLSQLVTSPWANTNLVDNVAAISSPFRRFDSIAFDQYGYFSQGMTLTGVNTTAVAATTQPQYTPVTGGAAGIGGALFVADLATGLSVSVTPQPFTISGTTVTVSPQPIDIPIQGPGGPIGVSLDASGNEVPIFTNGNTTGGSNIGGRIIRISPFGQVTVFAEGFRTSGSQEADSLANSGLTISFSADGTTLYAADDDGIWQFRTVSDLANSSSGQLIGLSDLRALGVPYDGLGSAVAVVDTGVDATNPAFRGRVAAGTNVITNGLGNQDFAPGVGTGTTTGTSTSAFGHGTLVAGVVAQFVPQATIEPVNIFVPFLNPGTSTTGGTGTGATTVTANALTTNDALYQGLGFVAGHPFVNDPVRPTQTSRVIASTLGFGTSETFPSEGQAFKRYSQVVISLKNQLHKFRKLGIAPIAAAGQFGAPLGSSGTTTTGGATNNAGNANVGDVNGMSLPAVLNEVISVTGDYSFPFRLTASTLPTTPPIGSIPRPTGPVIVFGNLTNTTPGGGPNAGTGGTLTTLSAAESQGGLFAGRILGAANRGTTTDFAAPALNVPTFTAFVTGQLQPLVFNQAGTSLSAGIVTGEFAMVASALNYWINLNQTGVTSSAYLTTPVGVNTLNFGPHAFKNLSAYNTPDGINAILAWTAVPETDPNDGLSQAAPPNLIGSPNFRQFAGANIGNAIAAIEGQVAIQYLLKHNIFPIIDTNKDGAITAQEIQNFVDNSTSMGLPEAGAMARLLGGTATTPDQSFTPFGEQPDPPGVLQRRFNFFDFAADGQLNGMITIAQLRLLSHNLLPTPDAFSIVDRQRASANGFLLNPIAQRNFVDLQHLLPSFEFVPGSAVAKFRGVSPGRFKVNRGVTPSTLTLPAYTLFDSPAAGTISNAPPSGQVQTTATTTTTTTATTGSTGSGSQATTPSSTTASDTSSTGSGATSPSGIAATTTPPQDPTQGSTSTSSSAATGSQAPAAAPTQQQAIIDGVNQISQANPATSTTGSTMGSASPTTGTTSSSSPSSGSTSSILSTAPTGVNLSTTPTGVNLSTPGGAIATTPTTAQAPPQDTTSESDSQKQQQA